MVLASPCDANGRCPDPRLTPEQLADLRASGLTDETIIAAGLYGERDGDRV